MHPDDIETFHTMIRRCSWFVASDFPDVTADDLYQDLWEWVLKTPSLDPNHDGCYSVLNRQAKTLAWKQRKENLHNSAQYNYRTSDVREILETVYVYEEWDGSFCPADARSGDGQGSIEVRMDVSWAMEKLPLSYKTAIRSRFHDRQIPDAGTAARKTLNRAIQRLTNILNSYSRSTSVSGHPGTRRAISNAQARAEIEDRG